MTADTEAHVAVVSLRTMRLVARLATVEDPRSIQSGRGGRVVVAHAGAGAISLRRTRVPTGSYNVQRAGARVLTPSLSSGRLTVLDRHGRVAGQVRVAAAAHDACVVS